jgi:hypothetical protein
MIVKIGIAFLKIGSDKFRLALNSIMSKGIGEIKIP